MRLTVSLSGIKSAYRFIRALIKHEPLLPKDEKFSEDESLQKLNREIESRDTNGNGIYG